MSNTKLNVKINNSVDIVGMQLTSSGASLHEHINFFLRVPEATTFDGWIAKYRFENNSSTVMIFTEEENG